MEDGSSFLADRDLHIRIVFEADKHLNASRAGYPHMHLPVDGTLTELGAPARLKAGNAAGLMAPPPLL